MLERVLKLQNDLTRLYFVAERWTGRCGTRSDLWTCCRHAVDSLDGRYDDRLTDAFYFTADKAAIRSKSETPYAAATASHWAASGLAREATPPKGRWVCRSGPARAPRVSLHRAGVVFDDDVVKAVDRSK
jgi:hypothetical protein